MTVAGENPEQGDETAETVAADARTANAPINPLTPAPAPTPQVQPAAQGAPAQYSPLRYFDETLKIEIAAINERRQKLARGGVNRSVTTVGGATWRTPGQDELSGINPKEIDESRMRPQPVPCDAIGVALSGGGIRSAAVCLGALQALDSRDVIDRADYLSTVSGGGYIGTCMTARMSKVEAGVFPFGASDIRDNDAVGYIRNYSNYLMPRARSNIVNLLDISAILLRGWLANTALVLNVLVGAAVLTYANYPNWTELLTGNFIERTFLIGLPWIFDYANTLPAFDIPFITTELLAGFTAFILLLWALIRSGRAQTANDANSGMLKLARFILGLLLVSAFLDLQPVCVYYFAALLNTHSTLSTILSSPFLIGAITIAAYARRLGSFLETTRISSKSLVQPLRVVTKVALFAAGMVLPLVLLAVYWYLTALLYGDKVPPLFGFSVTAQDYLYVFAATLILGLVFNGNAYSLHQFYKDRLTRAFLFGPSDESTSGQTALTDFKLSDIGNDCPYHIINAALNVQGSTAANRRGRNADFFTFTRHFVGSDLTHFAHTKANPSAAQPGQHDMERIDPRLNVGTAMAISGAALSANMGSSTVRWLSPTLALLNIRLGYWLRNPRALVMPKLIGVRGFFLSLINNLYLLGEMLNILDEKSGYIFLSDGGHIENLGIYQLLKRGCKLIIAIDAEADPDISCASLLKLERYARIDLGIRIVLPWERIAVRNDGINKDIDPHTPERAARHRGPHCAAGPIIYPNGSRGILLYFKSSLSGDEKDYVLNYKKRHMDFPHETTGDQFFTEEQFEVYRSLGYHVVDGFFSGDHVSFQLNGPYGWANEVVARNDVLDALGFQ